MKVWDFVCERVQKAWVITEAEVSDEFRDPIQIIKAAGDDVAAARNLFARADEPEMVEWAVYNLTACEKRYDYLLKKYRHERTKDRLNPEQTADIKG